MSVLCEWRSWKRFLSALALVTFGQSCAFADECVGSGKGGEIGKVYFNDGSVATDISRNGDVLEYTIVSPNRPLMKMRTFGGLYTLESSVGAKSFAFRYSEPLSDSSPLRVGLLFRADATVINKDDQSESKFVSMISVVGTKNVRIGECEYPVWEIDVINPFQNGGQMLTKLVEQRSLLSLSTTIKKITGSGPVIISEYRVVKLEGRKSP